MGARGRRWAQLGPTGWAKGRRVKPHLKASGVEGASPIASQPHTPSTNKKSFRAFYREAKGSSWCLEATPTA